MAKQRIADQILDRFFLLAGQAKQRAVVAGPEQHEAAGPYHRFDFLPDFFHSFPSGERLVYLGIEFTQLLFEGSGNLVKWFVGHRSNVVYRNAGDFHWITSLGRQSRSVV
jgi:hypothetical protein